ncbi:hypothetical protein MLD38_020040 [Melastoma candidum]|uniref:Uncharacterized protein n=1 Tax=Melastoma candidum TaxID=119954 RepID=A0ACB9QEM7_9MYRT|nr:hypothetical protein MLD38_020040 [Melastoma candidum]
MILLREAGNSAYACGFYCEANCDGPSYLFSVLIIPSHGPVSPAVDAYLKPNVVWSANRNNLVTANAVLELTAEGDLVLKDFDGKTTVWSAGMSGQHVSGINMTDVGNLVLFDKNDRIVWQSFDHPTDTLLTGQKLMLGKRLVASVYSTNWTVQSLISLSLTSQGLFGLAGSKRPLLYYSHSSHLSDTSFVTMINGCLFMFFNHSTLGEVQRVLDSNPYAVSAQYIRLDYDGHIRAFGYDDYGQFMFMGDMLSLEECHYPLVCGPYGICSKGQCSCPPPRDGVAYFNPINSKQRELGCLPKVISTCEDSQNQTFLHLRDVTYFNFVVDHAGIDASGCIDACAKNCSCKAAIFRPSLNNSAGNCFLPSEVLSLISMDLASYGEHDYSIYLKVLKPPNNEDDGTKGSPGVKGKKSFWQKVNRLSVGVAILFLFFSSVVLFLVWRKTHSNNETGDEFMEEMVGMPTRFTYAELKSITDDFHQKLGEGGSGAVFMGTLRDGTKVAVKRLDGSRHMEKSFHNEVGTIGSIHHINLTDYRNRPSMSTVIKVMDGVIEVEEDLMYDFAHPIFTRSEVPATVLSPSILSGPR